MGMCDKISCKGLIPMNAAVKPQIVHESEAQRQHVRVPLPAKAEVDGREYDVKDLSSGGVAIRGIAGKFTRGQPMKLRLRLPFSTFSMDVNLSATVQHANEAEKIVGCVFVDLNPEQISLINHILKAYVSGDVVASGDLLNVAARNNFVKERKHALANAQEAMKIDFRRQLPGLAAVVVLGLVAAYFILGNLYESMFVLKSSDAVISAPVVEVRASGDGFFKSQLDPEATLVQPGQPIGQIGASAGAPGALLASNCDCFVVKRYAQEGQYVRAGERLFTLVPTTAAPWIVAEIAPSEAARLAPETKAHITVFGSKAAFTGRVETLESGMVESTAPVTADMAYAAKPILVKIRPDQKIPVGLTNRPAHVTFPVH